MRALVGLTLCLCVTASMVPVHDFENASEWKHHPDGGNVPIVKEETKYIRQGKAMRIVYRDAPPHWGNLVNSCTVPPEAVALSFWLYKHAAHPQAKMHIWLLEPDGDAWVQHVSVENKTVGELPVGWHQVTLPVLGFAFERRGKGSRQMPTADRMLIGCNFGDLEVTVDSIEWQTQESMRTAPLPRTPDLNIERRERGSIAILDMGTRLPDGFKTAHSPRQLAQALREVGYGATVLQPGDFADPQVLNATNFDAVVLPFGAFFPMEARENFLSYLRAGGSFLSTDGYAFDRPVMWDGVRWYDVTQAITAEQHSQQSAPISFINTRYGSPGDAMTLQPHQIGVFDPTFELQDAVQANTVGVFADVPLRLKGSFKGFSASGLIGDNNPVFPPVYRRWIPVIEAFDARGNLRGSLLSISHNFAGVYKGSSWAFSGITSRQPILLGDATRLRLLQRVMETITHKTYLHSLKTTYACYRRGETAQVTVQASCFAPKPTSVTIVTRVGGRFASRQTVTLQASETRTLSVDVPTRTLRGDYIPVRVELLMANRLIDAIEGAFCIWDETVVARGPKVGWNNNYLTVDGVPTFLVGTNQTGMMFFSANENPAVWDRDFRLMAQHNIRILRILHFSPFAKHGYEGRGQHSSLDLRPLPPTRLRRQMDAIVQLAQKHRIVIFLTLHDWLGVTLSDEELDAQRKWNQYWAHRYRNVPGILYDIQNEPVVEMPDEPFVRQLWNDWLRQRYGTDEALRIAWHRQPPEAPMPDVPLGQRTADWDDVRSADLKRFETELLNRWVKANVEGIKAGDPDALVCVGYLPTMPPADKILGTRYTDFSNMHFYGSLLEFPLEFKLTDRRAYGKGLTLGEFGAQEAHQYRIHGRTGLPVQESVTRFQHVLHYAVGLGAAFVCNWDWKDFDEMVFPWGLMHPCTPVAKPWLHTLAQGAEFLRRIPLQYEPPQAWLLIPDNHRIGPRFDQLHRAMQRAVEILMNARVNFGVLNEEDLTEIPPSARVIFYPIPYCPPDEVFDKLLRWVQEGGVLYFSGNIGFDRTRQPTRGHRHTALLLPVVPMTSPFNVPDSLRAQPFVRQRVGKGWVHFSPYPIELRSELSDEVIYSRALGDAKVQPNKLPFRIEGDAGELRVMSIPTRDGGRLYTLIRTDERSKAIKVLLMDHAIGVDIKENGSVFVWTDRYGEVVGVESQGETRLKGKIVASASGHYAIVSLDRRALMRSRRLLVLPHQQREVQLFLLDKGRFATGTLATINSARKEPRQGSTLRFGIGEVAIISAE